MSGLGTLEKMVAPGRTTPLCNKIPPGVSSEEVIVMPRLNNDSMTSGLGVTGVRFFFFQIPGHFIECLPWCCAALMLWTYCRIWNEFINWSRYCAVYPGAVTMMS